MKLHRFLPFPLAAAIAIAAMLASPASATPVTTGLKLHLDASALTGLSDGATVNTWTDMSGLNNHATRTSGAPTYETNELGGKPVVRFPNGGSANFSFPEMTDIRTVFWVIKETTGNLHFLMGHSNNYDFHRGDGTTQLWSNSWASPNIKNGTTRLNGPAVNGTTTALPAGWNLISLGTTGNVTANRLTSDRTYGRTWEGDIAEVLIYNTVLTAEQELAVGGYLTAKYALTTSYPTGLTVSLTSPANNQAYPSGTSLSATANVVSGTAPYTVKFFTRLLPGGTFAQAGADVTTAPYTVDLGALSDGSYEIYTTATDSATPTPATSTSAISTFTVAPAQTTTTTVVSSGSPSIYGNSVTFTATVSPAPTGGSVQFYNGITAVGSPVAVNTTTGVATFTTTTLGVGAAEITADYLGYQIYETSDSSLASISQVVTKAPLTVTASNSIRSTNSANPTFTYQITGYKNSQTYGASSGVTGTPSLSTTADLSSPAGAYPITCALGTLAASNYSFTLVNGTLTIVATDTPEVVTLIDSIALASPNSWGGIAVTNPSSNIAITGAGPLTLGASGINMATSTVNLTLGAPITLGASQTWDTASGRTLTASGIISGSSMNLTKAGLGTLTLSGANTYTGATIVNAGTLTVGSGATGSLDSSSTLQMGGGIFNFSRTGTGQTQTVNGLTVSAGNSTVNNTTVGSILTLGAITRTPSIYGTVNFATMTGAIKTTTGNTNTILGPWATTGSTTTLRYAVGSPDGTTSTGIEARTGTTATAADLSNLVAGGNFEYSAATTTVGDLSANTLRYSGGSTTTTIGATNTLTLNGLMNAGTSTLTISGGPSTGGIIIGSTNELVIAANAQATTISSVIKDGGAAGTLVYSGGGALTLNNTNTYTGGTVLNGGSIIQANLVDGVFGTGSITLNNGARVQFSRQNDGAIKSTNQWIINSGTFGGSNSFGDSNYGAITLNGQLTVATEGTGNRRLSGIISGAGSILKTGSGVGQLVLYGANTYSGGTTHQGGILGLGHTNALGTGTLVMDGTTQTLTAEANLNVGTGVTNNIVLSKDCTVRLWGNWPPVNYDMLLSGTISGPGGMTLTGGYLNANKTLVLTGTNTYTGATTVNAGTLLVNNTTGSGTGSGNVSVTVGILGGSGSISGTVTIGNGTGAADSILAPGNSIGTIATGNLAFSSDGSYAAELNGSSVTTDVTNVTGTVSINAATTLTVSLTGSLAAGQKYFIVNNDGVDAVTGTFAGKAQDAVVGNYGGTDLKISYTGDSGTSAITGGNDIVLYTDASGSPYDTWANGTFTPPLTAKLPGDNQDGDSLTNLQEFAFGTQPTVSTGEIVYSGGTLTTPGAPKIVAAAGTYSMVFGRRADYVAAGLTYTVQFSADLITWVDNNDGTNPPVQVATNGTINAMSVPFVDFITTPSGPQKPTFARVKVVLAP